MANKKPFRAEELMTDGDGNQVQPGQWAVSLIWYQYDSDVPDGIRYSKRSRVERMIALDSCLFVPELKWMAHEDMQKPMGFVFLTTTWGSCRRSGCPCGRAVKLATTPRAQTPGRRAGGPAWRA